MTELFAVAWLCGAVTLTTALMRLALSAALALAALCAPIRIRRG